MADPEIGQHVGRNLQLAQTLAINGTPGFVIGTEIVRGAADLATLRRLINQARQAR